MLAKKLDPGYAKIFDMMDSGEPAYAGIDDLLNLPTGDIELHATGYDNILNHRISADAYAAMPFNPKDYTYAFGHLEKHTSVFSNPLL